VDCREIRAAAEAIGDGDDSAFLTLGGAADQLVASGTIALKFATPDGPRKLKSHEDKFAAGVKNQSMYIA